MSFGIPKPRADVNVTQLNKKEGNIENPSKMIILVIFVTFFTFGRRENKLPFKFERHYYIGPRLVLRVSRAG